MTINVCFRNKIKGIFRSKNRCVYSNTVTKSKLQRHTVMSGMFMMS